ncbi:hypothetical protein L6Q96_12515 [Candidatus Binatia bacterium]|nr:hypothetical protein [Candidatus Binatia bacterium]
MDDVWKVVAYLQAHPLLTVGGAVALVGMYYLLNRKPKATRDAEARLEQLRKERHDHYRQQRPLK